MTHRVVTLALITGLLAAAPMTAQTVVVTPSNPQGWQTATFGTPGASAGITSTFPESGNGSTELRFNDGQNQEADWFINYSTDRALSSLNALSYDWYRAPGGDFSPILAPAYSLIMSDGSYLVWERAYNESGDAPTGVWTPEDILNGNFWLANSVPTNPADPCSFSEQYVTLATFNQECFGNNGQVVGVDMYLGFEGGGSNTFDGAVDNVTIGFTGSQAVTYNFEPDAVTATPEPASLALLATGLLGVGGVAFKRRRKQSE